MKAAEARFSCKKLTKTDSNSNGRSKTVEKQTVGQDSADLP